MTRVKVTLREPTPEERRALERLASSDTAQARFAAARGVRLPTEVRGVPEPDRAVVEGAEVVGVERTSVRDLAGDLSSRRRGDVLLEQASPLRMGTKAASSPSSTARNSHRPRRQGTCRMNHLDRKPRAIGGLHAAAEAGFTNRSGGARECAGAVGPTRKAVACSFRAV